MRIDKSLLAVSSLLLLPACSSDSDSDAPSGSGGTVSTGGLSSSGGSSGGTESSGGTGGMELSTGGAVGEAGGSDSSAGGMAPDGAGGVAEPGGTGGMEIGGTGGAAIETLPDGSPLLFSNTGLYEADMVTLAVGVRPFEPQFALWTDDAVKKRWIWLPEGEQIDTTDMDYWVFPTGTRLFKEFNRDGVRVETRMMTKTARGGWQRVAYIWREDQMEADASVEGASDVSGTEHDVPSQENCGDCHFQHPDKILGFSAIQLAWDNPEPEAWTLARLQDAGTLSVAPPAIELPGDATSQAALGYLHANCGHCHNPFSSVTTRVTVSFWLSTVELGSVEETRTYQSTVCRNIELQEGGVPGITSIVDPGSPDTSSVFRRMDRRGDNFQMPPLGTELIDPTGTAAVQAWIESLSDVNCPTQ